MTYVNVVPARRMPVDRPWLTYICPNTLHVEPGMLVIIPLRGQDIVGVVWETTTEVDPKKTYRELKSIITSQPLFTDWSRQILAAAVDTHSTTLSWLVHRIVPDLRPQRLKKLFSTIVEAPKANQESPESAQLWYQERRSGIQSILQYAKSHAQRQIVLLTPTADDALQLVQALESAGRSAVYVHSQLSATAMAELIVRLNHGEPLCIVGGVYALCLPYPTEPCIILDQEEHYAHKESSQYPYYDVRTILAVIDQPVFRTTCAPRLSSYQQFAHLQPASFGQRTLVSMHGSRATPWISEEALTAIDEAHASSKRSVCIVPRRGYASALVCRTCGYAVSCKTCGQHLALYRGVTSQAECRQCHTTMQLPEQCPTCSGVQWKASGIGIEHVVEQFQTLRPELHTSPIISPDVSVDIAVDSYHAYHQLRHFSDIGVVLFIAGDAMLAATEYVVAERAWQNLHRVQAQVPQAQLMVQTWQPDILFWQRWLHGDAQSWYEHEIADRQRLHVSPFASEWILRGRVTTEEAKQEQRRVTEILGTQATVTLLPMKRSDTQRLLITFQRTVTPPAHLWTTIVQNPWHLDQHPISWYD